MLRLRPADAADYDYARGVHHTAYREMVISQFGAWDEQVQDKFFDKSWHASPYSIIVFENQSCGYCAIREDERSIQVMEFAVEVSRQGQGIASMLLARLRESGREKGKQVLLNVMKTNTKARALYERLGFSVYGENHFQFLMRA